jgi:hypothetical protein
MGNHAGEISKIGEVHFAAANRAAFDLADRLVYAYRGVLVRHEVLDFLFHFIVQNFV